MMKKQCYAWRREVRSRLDWNGIVSEFEFADGPENPSPPLKYEYRAEGILFDRVFEWRVTVDEDGYRVREDLFLPWSWYTVCIGCGILFLLSSVIFSETVGIVSVISFFLSFIFSFGFIGMPIFLMQLESPVADLLEESGEIYDMYPILPLILIFVPLTGSFMFIDGIGSFVVIGILCIAGFGYPLAQTTVTRFSFWWQSRLPIVQERLPLVASDYVFATFEAMILPVMFLLIYDESVFIQALSDFPYLFSLFYILMGLGSIVLIGTTFRYAQRNGNTEFRLHGQRISHRVGYFITAVVVIGATAIFLYVEYKFVEAAKLSLSIYGLVPAGGIIVISVVPFGYFLVGLVYQVFSVVQGTFGLLRQVERYDVDDVVAVQAKTYVLDHDDVFAGALTTGVSNYIVVSSTLVDELDDRELAAVLKHEEGHVVRGDASIAFGVGIFSPFVFIGKNVIYALLNFRSREFRADEYAAKKTSPDQLINALDELKQLSAEQKANRFKGVSPTLTPLNPPKIPESFLETYFGYYFGRFAMNQAHPSLSERIAKLRNSETDLA